MSEIRYHKFSRPFRLESGRELDLTVAYHTYGRLNEARNNVVWVCHALTASSDVKDWWPGTVEAGRFLDPEKWFVICANILGSCYGTTGPLSTNPATGQPYYSTFPALTIRDMARAHAALADALGIRKIHCLVGSSVGGFQATEWIAGDPGRFDRLILIATDVKASPWSIAIDETQRMAILADSTYGEPREDAASAGLATARALGLLTYRGPEGYNRTQQDPAGHQGPHRACTYQQYQGEKLVKRYNVYTYMTILNAFDTHDIGRDRGGVEAACARIECPVVVVGLSTDIIFTPPEMRRLARLFSHSEYHQIDSAFGHDGFLVEADQLNDILNPFINQ